MGDPVTCRGFHGDCPNKPARDGLCWGHVKARQDGRGIDIELQAAKGAPRDRAGLERVSQRDILREAAIAYADADGDEDFRRADDNLAKAAQRFGKSAVGDAVAEALAERTKAIGDAIRNGLAARRAQGLSIGRPATGLTRMSAWRHRQKAQAQSSDVTKT